MKKIIATAFAALLASTAAADTIAAGAFKSFATSSIGTALPSNANGYSALAGNVSGVTITRTGRNFTVESRSVSEFAATGWANRITGTGAATGFAGVGGVFGSR